MNKIHGEWRVSRLGENLMLSQGLGSWNGEGAEGFAKDFIRLASTIDHSRPWAAIGCASHWQLGDSGILEPLFRLDEWFAQNNGIVGITVVDNALQKYLIDQVVDGIDPGFDKYLCFSYEEAVEYLGQRGFEADIQEVRAWFEECVAVS